MSLKPEVSLGVSLATGALVYAIYMQATPSIADIRVADPHNGDIEAGRKMAAWTAVGVVAGISLISKDPTPFVLGGGLIIAMDWWTRHANEVDPKTGKATAPMSQMAPSGMPGDVPVDFAQGVGTR